MRLNRAKLKSQEMSAEGEDSRRHSVAEEPELAAGALELAQIEARNGLKQFDLALRIIEDALQKGDAFKIRPSMILALHREALDGLSGRAGTWRPSGVRIEKSQHQPVGAHQVPEYIEKLCDYLNENWHEHSAIHLSAYSMWRLNWIHPFTDGNGRTSRIFSYIVLSVKLNIILRGTNTIPDQIVDNRVPYFDALEAADKAYQEKRIDVSEMELLLSRLLAKQLLDLFERANNAPERVIDP
jgi:Fic family protein